MGAIQILLNPFLRFYASDEIAVFLSMERWNNNDHWQSIVQMKTLSEYLEVFFKLVLIEIPANFCELQNWITSSQMWVDVSLQQKSINCIMRPAKMTNDLLYVQVKLEEDPAEIVEAVEVRFSILLKCNVYLTFSEEHFICVRSDKPRILPNLILIMEKHLISKSTSNNFG